MATASSSAIRRATPTVSRFLAKSPSRRTSGSTAASALTATRTSLRPRADNKYTVYIGGNYLGRNNTNIGTAALTFAQADIVGICKKQNTVETCSDSANSNVYAYPPYLTDSSPLKKPDVVAQAVYTYGTGIGVPGDPTVNWNAPTCSTGSFTFDNNTTMSGDLPQTTLFSGSSFNCTVNDSARKHRRHDGMEQRDEDPDGQRDYLHRRRHHRLEVERSTTRGTGRSTSTARSTAAGTSPAPASADLR